MKYLYWLTVLLTVIIRRLVFPLIYLAIPFRSYLRNTVYNYHLNNGLYIKRLYERNPKLNGNKDKWLLDGGTHSSTTGIVYNLEVGKLEYYFALSLWLLLDDDANQDTYDKGFNQTIIDGERKKWMPEWIKGSMRRANDRVNMTMIRGNSFDLGDIRADYPLYEFWSVLWWTLRNPAYNFNYKFNQMTGDKYYFQIVIFGRLFGWKEDGYVTVKDKKVSCYSWELGKKI